MVRQIGELDKGKDSKPFRDEIFRKSKDMTILKDNSKLESAFVNLFVKLKEGDKEALSLINDIMPGHLESLHGDNPYSIEEMISNSAYEFSRLPEEVRSKIYDDISKLSGRIPLELQVILHKLFQYSESN